MNPLFQASILYLSTCAIVLLVTKKIFRLSDHYVHFTVLCGQLSFKTLAEFLPLELTSLILHTAVTTIPL